jgi:hypothetical protein
VLQREALHIQATVESIQSPATYQLFRPGNHSELSGKDCDNRLNLKATLIGRLQHS